MAQFPIKNGLIQGTLDGTPSGGTLSLGGVSLALGTPASGVLTNMTGTSAWLVFKYKNGDTSRTSTTTLADDSDLTASLVAGSYMVRIGLVFSNASGTPGEKFKVNYTGTYSIGTGTLEIGNHTGAGIRGSYPNSTDADIFAPTFSDSNRNEWGYVTFFLKATGSGTLSLQWAQNSSSVDATTLKKGSHMQIHRLE